MGSKQADEMPAAEVAKLLGVDIRTLQAMVRHGLLQPCQTKGPIGARTLFSVDEVAAFAEVRSKKLDLATVASLAMRAYVLSKNTERRIDHLSDLLGLNLPKLKTDEPSVVRLFIQAQDFELEGRKPSSPEDVRQWASVLFGIDEAYLDLVAHYTSVAEPWQPFFDLGQRMLASAPSRPAMRRRDAEAYAYLESACRHLRGVMYFYYRSKNGVRAADKAFPEMDDRGIDAEMTALLYPS